MNEVKRQDPRYSALLDVKMFGYTFSTNNLSLGGLQLSIDRMTGDNFLRKFNSDTVEVTLVLPDSTNLDFKAKKIYFSPYDDSEYLMGLQFIEYPGSSRTVLAKFISDNVGSLLRIIK